MKLPQWFFVALFAALVLRLALIPNPGFEADISFWKSWGLATFDKGIVEGMKVTNNNYPTPFAYTLGAMVWAYSLFKDPHNFNEFWQNTNLLFLFVSKLPSILADFGIAGIILWIGKNAKRLGFPPLRFTLYAILASVYLLNPIALIDGALWGQVDSLGVFVFLIAFCLSLTHRPFWAGAVFMLAMMTKLQNMIYGPLFFLFIYQLMGYRGLIRAITGATLAFFGLNIEFFLSHNMDRVVGSLTENFDYFPWMSLNAFNLWWIVSGGHGMQVSDKLLAIGITNAKTIGLLLFSSFYLFTLLRQIFNPIKPIDNNNATALMLSTLRTFLESLILVNAAFFLFQTQSHDRYAFPLSVFLLLWAPFMIADSGKRIAESNKINSFFTLHASRFTLGYTLFTLLYFYNLHTALVLNYPNNGLPWLSSLSQPFFTITTSIGLLSLFAVFLRYLARNTKRIVFIVAVAALFTILFLINLPLMLKKPVSLTKLSPYIYTQGYGQLTENMPVNAFIGWREWHFLSVQYAFYRKGFGTHAASRMDFDLGKNFKRFTTDVGIDTEAGPAGSAIFEIYGDNRLLNSSGVVKRFDLPKHADVNVSGVRFLTLITIDAGDGITDDHTDWLRPTLWP